MCGIAGHVGPRTVAALEDCVLDALRHRGPDGQRTERCTTANVIADFAFARLAIVDLSDAGQQPMSNEDGRFTMVFNGEIYNSPALRQECESAGHRFRSSMDGEVILHMWETEGPSALERLNGIFALALLDSATGELFLARDPLGVKPLVYAEAGGELWFASELRALARHGGADRRGRSGRLGAVPVVSLDSRSAHPVRGRAQHRAGNRAPVDAGWFESVALLRAATSYRITASD